MSARKVNYDQLAPLYNQRFEGSQRSDTAEALHALVHQLGAQTILEVGCGTGRWLVDLRSVTKKAFGLDLSTGMLRQARDRSTEILLTRGRGGRLPFPNCSFDLIYCVNAIHHFAEQESFVREAKRLLRPGGALAIVGFDPRLHRDKWYVYDYFESTYPTDLERFPSWGTVVDWMAAAGFLHIDWKLIEWIEDPKQGRKALDDPYLQKHATSQLALLSDEEYARGLNRLTAALEAAEVQGETLHLPTTIFMRMLTGRTDPSGNYQL